ncbi:uncharacterized protein LOC130742497 [Lotus japonicus]|uniref:uncharacterized protein LOC130742497 n=1 Tax=Lotus japonicus TaxID=34305 RepID=UPI002588011F|nr:uncharacterized protein LOC130742497 [Lotus japonicus]
MAATARVLPISNEKFKKTLSWPMSSCASLSMEKVVSSVARRTSPDRNICVYISNGVPFFYGPHETKDRIASLNEFVRSSSTPDDAPEAIIVAALKQRGSGKYTAPIGMGAANYPPMVINDDNGKACKVVDWDKELGKIYKARTMNGKASPSAPPFWYDNFGKDTPAASASSYGYPSVLNEDHDDDGIVTVSFSNNRYCCIGGNGGGESSSEASTAYSFKNAIVKDSDEASSTGRGSTAPKKMKKKDNNFDTGVDCMAGFGGCVPFKFKIWVKRSKDVYAIDG